ncbi:secreted antigen 1 [Babesia caballi]|uniref:Secreted antigen 1 n=1 Tax=Babesia caballi TaxID=5871 RepID=A0AAV4LM73_BABCB|nr:secreted antigen 1 [Babesia caballi]
MMLRICDKVAWIVTEGALGFSRGHKEEFGLASNLRAEGLSRQYSYGAVIQYILVIAPCYWWYWERDLDQSVVKDGIIVYPSQPQPENQRAIGASTVHYGWGALLWFVDGPEVVDEMRRCITVPPPKSLKEALEFAGALSESQGNLKDIVGKMLLELVSGYSNEIHVDTYFKNTLDNLKELRVKLVAQTGTYGSYTNLPSQPSCLADAVSDTFPKLYCTLSYFNFNVNGSDQRGVGWANGNCSSISGLSNWLGTGTSIPSGSPVKIWSGGDLQCSKVSEFSSQLNQCVSNQSDGKFALLLAGLLFLRPSSPELTSTFMVFISEVCTIVSGDDLGDEDDDDDDGESRKKLHEAFKSQYGSVPDYATLTQCCSSLKSNIDKLIGKESKDNETSPLRIPRNSHKLYLKKLQSDNIDKYIEWLADNLQKLIANLKQMETDCTSWDPKNMSGGQVAGPFPYGFGFPQSGSWKTQTVKSSLQKLTAENSTNGLPALKHHVENLIASSTSSVAGSIAGSLLGTAAVGGAGAAVALNVGGVTTALKGVIGILK